MATALTGSYQQLLTRPEEDPISASYPKTIASAPQINDAIKATIPKTIATTSASHPNTIAPTPQIDDPIKAGTPLTSSVASTKTSIPNVEDYSKQTLRLAVAKKIARRYSLNLADSARLKDLVTELSISIPKKKEKDDEKDPQRAERERDQREIINFLNSLSPKRGDATLDDLNGFIETVEKYTQPVGDYQPGIFHEASIAEINKASKNTPKGYDFNHVLASTQVIAQRYNLNLSDTAHVESLLKIYYAAPFTENKCILVRQEITNFLNSRPHGRTAVEEDVRRLIGYGYSWDDVNHISSVWNRFTTNLGHAYNAIMPGKSLGTTLKPIHTRGKAEMEKAQAEAEMEKAQAKEVAQIKAQAQAKAVAQIKAQAQAKAVAQIKAQPNPSISDKYPMSPYGMTQSQLLPGDQKTQQPSGFKTSN